MVVFGGEFEVTEDVDKYDDELGDVGEVVHVDTAVLGDLIDHKAEAGGYLLVGSDIGKDTQNLVSVILGEGGPAGIEDGHDLAFDVLGNLIWEAFDKLEKVVVHVDNLGDGGYEDLLVRDDSLDIVRVVLLYGLEEDEGGEGLRGGGHFGFGAHLLILLLDF